MMFINKIFSVSRTFFLFNLVNFLKLVNSLCDLPEEWSGKWYQGKHMDILTINQTHFINKGQCIENKQDKFLFYENDECYRCIFVMQKHSNVLQFRASYCTEQNDFYANCENLSPESELVTIYRDSAIPEKCSLNGLYVLSNSQATSSSINSDERSYRSSNSFNTKCIEKNPNKNSMIMECSDQSMLKLQFGKCTNMPTFIVNCVAHWTEGNMNYLIGRISSDGINQKPTYKCIAYSEKSKTNSANDLSSFHSIGNDLKLSKHMRRQQFNNDFVDFSQNNDEIITEQSNIQLSVSQDEFCRNIDNIIDEQFSFNFNKVQNSLHTLPHGAHSETKIYRHKFKRQSNSSISTYALLSSLKNNSSHRASHVRSNGGAFHHCKFPRWLNKRWHNLKQTKMFTIDYKLDSLLVHDQKSSIILNKYTCSHMRARKSNYVQAIVKSLNGCSSGYQCLTITGKSDFVLEIKFGKITYGNNLANICDNQNEADSDHSTQEFVYVDTNYGVNCPLKNGIYEKLNTKSNTYRSLNNFDTTTVTNDEDEEEPCKYLTQTQTLQIGCQSDQQYSLRTKLCYPNHQYNKYDASIKESSVSSSSTTNNDKESSFNIIVDSSNSINDLKPGSGESKLTTTAYTQLESEINLVCLAHWKHNGNHVIVSRTMTNEVLCSIWSSSQDGKFLKLLEIDSNCNYDKKSSNSQQNPINYGFVFKRSCNEQKPSMLLSSYIGTGSSSLFSSLGASLSASSSSSPLLFISSSSALFSFFLNYLFFNQFFLLES